MTTGLWHFNIVGGSAHDDPHKPRQNNKKPTRKVSPPQCRRRDICPGRASDIAAQRYICYCKCDMFVAPRQTIKIKTGTFTKVPVFSIMFSKKTYHVPKEHIAPRRGISRTRRVHIVVLDTMSSTLKSRLFIFSIYRKACYHDYHKHNEIINNCYTV